MTRSALRSRAFGTVLLLLAALPAVGYAQFTEHAVTFTPSDGEPLDVQYLTIPDSLSLIDLVRRSSRSNYPLVVIRQEVFLGGIAIMRDLSAQKSLYDQRDREWQRLDTIQGEKLAKLEEIIDLQERRVAVHDSANAQLMRQIGHLNEQLDMSVELTEKSLRGRQARNIYIGVLGGAIGFSVGALVAVLAQ